MTRRRDVLSILPDELAAVDVRLFTGPSSRAGSRRSFPCRLAGQPRRRRSRSSRCCSAWLRHASTRSLKPIGRTTESSGFPRRVRAGAGAGAGTNPSSCLPSCWSKGTDPVEISLPVEEAPGSGPAGAGTRGAHSRHAADRATRPWPWRPRSRPVPESWTGSGQSADLSRGSGGRGGSSGTGQGTGIGSGDGAGLGPGQGGGVGGGAYRPGNGVSPPRLLREVKPQYTAEAMRAKIQGTVWLEVVVQPDGTVGDVRITKSLDPGVRAGPAGDGRGAVSGGSHPACASESRFRFSSASSSTSTFASAATPRRRAPCAAPAPSAPGACTRSTHAVTFCGASS